MNFRLSSSLCFPTNNCKKTNPPKPHPCTPHLELRLAPLVLGLHVQLRRRLQGGREGGEGAALVVQHGDAAVEGAAADHVTHLLELQCSAAEGWGGWGWGEVKGNELRCSCFIRVQILFGYDVF